MASGDAASLLKHYYLPGTIRGTGQQGSSQGLARRKCFSGKYKKPARSQDPWIRAKAPSCFSSRCGVPKAEGSDGFLASLRHRLTPEWLQRPASSVISWTFLHHCSQRRLPYAWPHRLGFTSFLFFLFFFPSPTVGFKPRSCGIARSC